MRAEYVIWALQHLCLPEGAVWYPCCHFCCSLEDASRRNGISWCYQASLMSPVLVEWQSSAMLSEGVCLVIHVLNTGRNSLGKDGLSAMEGRLWLEQGVGKGWKRLGGCLQRSQGEVILPLSEAQQIMADSCRLFLPIPEWCLYLGEQGCLPENDFWLVTNFPRHGLIQQSDHLRKLSSSAAAERMKIFFPIQALFSLIWSETCSPYCTFVGFVSY